jgi:hypothetical protein
MFAKMWLLLLCIRHFLNILLEAIYSMKLVCEIKKSVYGFLKLLKLKGRNLFSVKKISKQTISELISK